MNPNWCYVACDSVILPITTVITFLWTLYQQKQIKEIKDGNK